MITRGKEIIYVRIGIGMNFLNKTPLEGIALSEILNTKNICEYYWTAKILKAINAAIHCNDRKDYVVKEANRYLAKEFLPKGHSSYDWKIKEVDLNGNLVIFNSSQEKILKRF